MQTPIATRMRPKTGSTDERRLARLFRALDAPSRQTLLSFAEFLSARCAEAESTPEMPSARCSVDPVAQEPVREPRPAEETVVAAIKRLRRTYPMLDAGLLLNEASSLMAAHLMQGRAAAAVIDELETVFARRYDEHRNARD